MYEVYDGFNNRIRFDTLERVVHHIWYSLYVGWDVRVYDCWDRQPVDIITLQRLRDKMIRDRVAEQWKKRPYKFRDGPVPLIRRCRWHREQTPRTFQELRQEGNRAKRKHLPTDRDDYHYRHTERNWKSQRKTQWKQKLDK